MRATAAQLAAWGVPRAGQLPTPAKRRARPNITNKAVSSAREGSQPVIWTLEVPGWVPCELNKLLGHWGNAASRKKHDREIIARAVLAYAVPPATCKRIVSLLIVLPKGQRAYDPDAPWKSLLDALVSAGALKNDSRAWVQAQPVRFARGEGLTTFITLQDVR